MTITHLPVGEGTIVEPSRGNGILSTGRFGPKIKFQNSF